MNLVAIDFETTSVDFFDRKLRKKANWSGHPRLATATIVSFANSDASKAISDPRLSDVPSAKILLFHNASFDIQVGINLGAFNAEQF